MFDDIENYRAEERLKDGRPVIVRAIRADDKEKIIQAFQNLERESIYTRLFTHKTELTDGGLKKITEIDFEREVGLVVSPSGRNGRGHYRFGPVFRLSGAGRTAPCRGGIYGGRGLSRPGPGPNHYASPRRHRPLPGHRLF